MKIKTSELTGPALDWAVVKASGQNAEYWLEKYASEDRRCMCESPSTDWSQGGPTIEREKISLEIKHDGWWVASFQYNYSDYKEHLQLAETPLIAAMRCYVASKLGDKVEVPNEFIS